jgi:pyrophosphate--fructose-6-phosphate 1-phosphotransferase
VLFRNYDDGNFLLMGKEIFSQKTLRQILEREKLLSEKEEVPKAIRKIFDKSVPKFKTQLHFYGYDGRGTDPTRFDCIYTYNLGLTVFTLIANGATGQMAAIKNLEHKFSKWEPIGIPIAPLMNMEERGGKMSLVLEKSLVDLQSPAFQVVKALRENWLGAVEDPDAHRRPGPIRFSGKSEEDRPMTLALNALSG